MSKIKPIICTYLFFLQMLSIFKKLKNVKRVCPKIINKGKKEQKGQKRWKIWTPRKEKRPWKWESQNATTIYFLCIINDCV